VRDIESREQEVLHDEAELAQERRELRQKKRESGLDGSEQRQLETVDTLLIEKARSITAIRNELVELRRQQTIAQGLTVTSVWSKIKTLQFLQIETPPTLAEDKLYMVHASDFLFYGQMSKDFFQYFYLRDEAAREIKFLDDFLKKEEDCAAQISGSPGSGKSLTVFQWAWDASKKRDFALIVFMEAAKPDPGLNFRFGYFKQGKFMYLPDLWSFVSGTDSVEDAIQDLFNGLGLSNPVVVLDGVTDLTKSYANPFKRGKFGKLIFVTSQQLFWGEPDKTLGHLQLDTFTCYQWTLKDYCNVCCLDNFWNSLDPKVFSDLLDGEHEDLAARSPSERTPLIENKYFYAGYSARWMFRYSKSKVVGTVNNFALKVEDITRYLFARGGDKSDNVINHLLVEVKVGQFALVSQFAIRILAALSKHSHAIAKHVLASAVVFEDARMVGAAYEVHIRCLLKDAVGKELAVEDMEGKHVHWPVSAVEYYNRLADLSAVGRLPSGTWFLPNGLMQSGFDMFQLCYEDAASAYTVRFVQVTIQVDHSFVEDSFVEVLSMLKQFQMKGRRLGAVEVVALLPEYRLRQAKYRADIPIERVWPGATIAQHVCLVTMRGDTAWRLDPIQSLP